MIFPNTHEAIVDQDTWDIAHRLRLRKRPKAANGTYTHRLSGLIYCADCGGKNGFSAAQTGAGMENTTIPPTLSSVGTTAAPPNNALPILSELRFWKRVILKAIQAVSRYALENEAEFVADLKSVWDENKAKSEDTGQHELEEARKTGS